MVHLKKDKKPNKPNPTQNNLICISLENHYYEHIILMWVCPYPSTKRIPSKGKSTNNWGLAVSGLSKQGKKILHRVVLQENVVQTQAGAYACGKSAQNQAFYADGWSSFSFCRKYPLYWSAVWGMGQLLSRTQDSKTGAWALVCNPASLFAIS